MNDGGSTALRALRGTLSALTVWAVFVVVAFGLWVPVVAGTGAGNPPADPPLARSYYRWMVQLGAMTQHGADQKVADAWRVFLVWSLRRTAVALGGSALAVPFLARWFAARPRSWADLWEVTAAAFAFAFLSPLLTVPLLA